MVKNKLKYFKSYKMDINLLYVDFNYILWNQNIPMDR